MSESWARCRKAGRGPGSSRGLGPGREITGVESPPRARALEDGRLAPLRAVGSRAKKGQSLSHWLTASALEGGERWIPVLLPPSIRTPRTFAAGRKALGLPHKIVGAAMRSSGLTDWRPFEFLAVPHFVDANNSRRSGWRFQTCRDHDTPGGHRDLHQSAHSDRDAGNFSRPQNGKLPMAISAKAGYPRVFLLAHSLSESALLVDRPNWAGVSAAPSPIHYWTPVCH
jgi:hypothetical protein